MLTKRGRGAKRCVFEFCVLLIVFITKGYSGEYRFLLKWGEGQFNYPHGIAVDSSTNVYATDGNQIQKFTNDGILLDKWGSSGSADSQFSSPTTIVVDSLNNVYVLDRGNRRIQKFTANGEFITKWGDFYGSVKYVV